MGSESMHSPPAERPTLLERRGWLVFATAVVLFAIERFLLFTTLPGQDQTHGFLFGEPPYSMFDVLLGFEVPDEGLLFLLQPHNILLASAQAFHMALNVALVYSGLWLIERAVAGARRHPWRYVLASAAIIAACAASVVAALSCLSTPTVSQEEYAPFTDSEFGVRFEHPSSMVPQVTRDSRVEAGARLSSITARLVDRREVTTIFFQAVDDPILASSPGWYPPSESQLRIFAAMDLGNLALDHTPDNSSAVDAALDAASLEKVAGFPALTYRVFLNDADLGYIYVKGANIVTPRRTYTIMAIGGLSAESPLHEPVKAERVDDIWARLLSSISLER